MRQLFYIQIYMNALSNISRITQEFLTGHTRPVATYHTNKSMPSVYFRRIAFVAMRKRLAGESSSCIGAL